MSTAAANFDRTGHSAPGASRIATAKAMVGRTILLLPRTPAAFAPSIIFPILLTVALSGGQAGVALLPGYPVARQIDWVMPFALVQSGAIAGMGAGFSLIRDLEGRFFDRFLVAPVSRVSLVLGFMLSAFARALPALLIVPIVGFIDGARMPGGALGLLCLAVANQGAALIGGGWGVGMALRFKTMRAGPLMFLPVFVTVFLSPAQVPLQYLTGWLKPVAKVNPVTQILDLARAGFYKEFLWGNVWPGLVVLAVFIPLFGWFALRGLRRLD